MSHLFRRCCVLLASAAMVAGCSSYQPTKNVWKGTKDVWYTYVSPSASVDYGEKGDLSPRALALTNCMMGLDVELGRFERTMINADKPPTRQWMDSLFAAHPWLDGFAGVKYDGTLLGQEPANPLKQLDFIPLPRADNQLLLLWFRFVKEGAHLDAEAGRQLFESVQAQGAVPPLNLRKVSDRKTNLFTQLLQGNVLFEPFLL